TLLHMELHEGRNRQVRRMLADVDHEVKKLRRIQIGPLKLKGLQPGQWRELTPAELKSLRRAVDMDDQNAAPVRRAPHKGRKNNG
ncbi:MAG TPA: hypothetical protein VG711_07305, partial [Phycisphaerales bacterium]|nr:hypothetical protein [Phycisphaerales bacterium]